MSKKFDSVARPAAGAKAGKRTLVSLPPAARARILTLFDWAQSFEHVALPLGFASADGKTLLKVNDAFARLYGSTPEAINSTPFENLVAPRSRAAALARMRDAGAGGQVTYKATHIRHNGGRFRAQVDVTPIRNKAGSVDYLALCMQCVQGAQRVTAAGARARKPVTEPAAVPALDTGSQRPAADFTDGDRHARPTTDFIIDVFWIASADLQSVQYLNETFETVWGQPRAGFSPARWLDSIVAEDRELAASAFARLGVQNEEVSVNYRIRRPDGTIRHIRDRGIMARDKDGNAVCATGIATDISGRVEEELSLREAHEFNRQVMADAQEGVIVLDIDGRCIAWNVFMEQFTGDTVADVYGRHLQELIPALNDIGFEALLRNARHGNIQPTPDLPYDPPDGGARRWCVLRLAPRRDAHGHITGVIGTIEDITARKQIEAELRASEARYRNLVERASDLIYETDPAGHFTYFNIRAAKRLFGYSEQELRGMSILDLVHPEFRATVEAIYREQLDQKIPNTYHEFPVCAKDGRIVWLGQNITLLFEGARVMRRIAVARDITERKRTNERRRQNRIDMEGLQDWYVALQTAIALAHELNQPLNAVCSYNEAALRMLDSGNPYPDKLLHALKASVQQSERAGKVMRDLLGFLGKGHLAQTIEPIDINAVVRQVLADMEVEVRASAIPILLVRRLSDGLSPVLSHRLHVEKVLGNLLRNSIEAIRGNGDLHGTITVATSRREASVLVTVHDSGPGFNDEHAARMLEPFYTSKDKGVGMGLPVCRALVEAHGGTLWAESGNGATFHFTLPFVPVAPTAP